MLKRRVTEEELIEKLGDYNIFAKYFGDFNLTSCYNSIFREDNHPSTGFFKNSNGRIIYNDYAQDEKLNSIQFVQKLFDLNYFQAIEKIIVDFEIPEDTQASVPMVKKTLEEKKPKKIDLTVRKMTKEELDYWAKYYITENELDDNLVYGIKEFRINYFLIPESENSIRFAYIINYKGNQFAKIYSPFDEKYKWSGSVTGNPLFGYDELPYKSDTLIITKGNKDRIILKKYFSDVIAVQRESKTAITTTDAKYLSERYKNIYVNFDIDEQVEKKRVKHVGIEAANELAEKYGWKTLFIPEVCYTDYKIKDVADLTKQWGIKGLEKWLKNENLI